MSVCKFFLQGTCKFGDNCKFSHQINDVSQQNHGASIMRQTVANSPQIDTNLLVKSVVTDMMNAEKGGHWLLSSYAPFKDKPCFPGFENRSFEEVRYGYYEAMKNGSVEQYKQQLQMTLQEAAMKMKMLQNPTAEIIGMLIQIYNTTVGTQNITPAPFGSSQTTSVFSQNQPAFDQNSFAQKQSPFGQNQTNFSQNQSSNQTNFGQNQSPTQTNFAQNQSPNQPNFGQNQSPTQTNFVQNQSPNQPNFGQNQSPAQTNFAQNQPQGTSIFALANQEFFGKNPTNQQKSIFGPQTNTNTNLFTSAPLQNTNQNNMFPTGQSIFNNNQNNPGNSLFVKSNFAPNTQTLPFNSQSNTLTTQNSIFVPGSNTFNTNNVFNPQPVVSPFQNQSPTNAPFPNQLPSVSNSILAPTSSQSFSFNKAAASITSSPFVQQPLQTNIFATNTVPQNASPFQQQPIIPNNTASNSPFSTSPQSTTSNIFATQSSIFNTQSGNVDPKMSDFVFNQPTPEMKSVFGGGLEVIDNSAYSKLEDLTESEIKSFESACFEFGKIPEKPPTAQMCT
ncbi:nucleoporin-like protein 2 [Holotrichia oblita]|uniref:Nucleoporin-like protein 2 n=2 Tax=Holotrichia oblita TaxID=644536 RepID=A0ACB9SL60_HOLOL|nr:nucleoporin-like protein 2 [Holotrichia oblita]KAI4456059.1 nucleoporin-like protein 2 [Holotrichia oblita]